MPVIPPSHLMVIVPDLAPVVIKNGEDLTQSYTELAIDRNNIAARNNTLVNWLLDMAAKVKEN